MRYFNGFSLEGEEKFFDEIISNDDMTVAGFSYGAIKAFEYAYNSSERIDRLILISPAYFQNKTPSFIKTQLRYFRADEESYTRQFLSNVASPSDTDLTPYLSTGSMQELDRLLSYRWDLDEMQELIDRGTEIEIFLGGKDIIMDTQEAFKYFSQVAICYMIKDAGHILLS